MDVLRYASETIQADGTFAFSNMAPGRYYMLSRTIPDDELNNPGSLPDWYDPEQRNELQREAKKAGVG